MWKAIERWLAVSVASQARPHWQKGLRSSKSSPFMALIGQLLGVAFCIFSIYNIYAFTTSGKIFVPGGRGAHGWIFYSEDAFKFVAFIIVYSLPVIVPAVFIAGRVIDKRKTKQDTFKQFADGSGQPSAVRRHIEP